MTRVITLIFIGIFLNGCGNKIDIRQNYQFYYYENYGYTNVYLEGLGVLPKGCDSIKWNEKIIVAKCEKWRYDTKEECYFIIDMDIYSQDSRQELSSGVSGPYLISEFGKIDPLKELKFIGASESNW